jgi:hypothetical protein
MKTILFLFLLVTLLVNGQAQDTVMMKYNYAFEYGYSYNRVVPLQKYAKLFSLSNEVEGKEDNKRKNLIELKKTWRAKKNENLRISDFMLKESKKGVHPALWKSMKQRVEARKGLIIALYRERNALNPGSEAARRYLANPPQIPNPYPECIARDFFKYLIPTLQEVDWIHLPQAKELTQSQDTLIQSRLFFTDSAVIILGNRQWKLVEIKYCFGYNLPDTVNNTHFIWEVLPIEVPKFMFKGRTTRTIRIHPKKKKKIKIGKLSYIFSGIQKLHHKKEYLINCRIVKNKIIYNQNIYLGKGSQLVFSNIVLNVLEVNGTEITIKYQRLN